MIQGKSKAQKILDTINKPLKKFSVHIRVKKTRRQLPKYKKINPAIFRPINPEIEKKHIEYWSRLYKKVDLSYIRMSSNFSGIEDYKYVPDDIFCAITERTLNHFNYSYFESNKNYYERFLDANSFPKTFLRKDLGQFLDKDYNFISQEEAENIFINIKEDFIIKLATGYAAKCGKSIKLFKHKDGQNVTLNDLDKIYKNDYIIQEAVKQHEFFAQFNKDSLNTLRVVTYRSVKDNKIHIVKVGLKTGTSSLIVDNFEAGGLFNHIHSDGRLDDYSYSKLLQKHYEHPSSKIKFKNLIIPHFQKIIDEIKKTALRTLSQRVLGFDVALNSENEVKIIELNIIGGSSGIWQLSGGPLFGKFTDEIVEYCIKKQEDGGFQNLRI